MTFFSFMASLNYLAIHASLSFPCLSSESACQCWSWDAVRGRTESAASVHHAVSTAQRACSAIHLIIDRPLFSLLFSFFLLRCYQQLQIKHTVTEAEIQKLKNKVRD